MLSTWIQVFSIVSLHRRTGRAKPEPSIPSPSVNNARHIFMLFTDSPVACPLPHHTHNYFIINYRQPIVSSSSCHRPKWLCDLCMAHTIIGCYYDWVQVNVSSFTPTSWQYPVPSQKCFMFEGHQSNFQNIILHVWRFWRKCNRQPRLSSVGGMSLLILQGDLWLKLLQGQILKWPTQCSLSSL